MASLDELKTKLEGMKPKATAVDASKNQKSHPMKRADDGRKNNRGHKGKAGRKTTEETLVRKGLKQIIDDYAKGDAEIEVEDPKTGQKIKVKKPRILWAMETFFTYGMAMASKGEQSGITSLKEFFDRAVGKAAQPIRGEGEDDAPIKIGINVGDILKKAYGDKED